MGRHHPERFSFRAQSIGETVHPTLNRRGPGATPGEPSFYCRAQHFSGLAEQHRHLFCKQAQTGAAPVAGSFLANQTLAPKGVNATGQGDQQAGFPESVKP